MTGEANRTAARATFDDVAALYDAARPGYPAALYDDLVAFADLMPNARLLEIGLGTGHATEPLARRGFRIDGIELGEHMAAVARQRLVAFPNVHVAVADFDRWAADTHYALVYSASAYHWLNPETRIARIAALLEPGGSVAVFRNHHVEGDESAHFNAAAARIYAHVLGPERAAHGLPRPHEIQPVEAAEWRACGRFSAIATRTYCWHERLTAHEYIRALNTHSDHRLLAENDRARLFDGLVRLIDEKFGGSVVKEYLTLLQTTRLSA